MAEKDSENERQEIIFKIKEFYNSRNSSTDQSDW